MGNNLNVHGRKLVKETIIHLFDGIFCFYEEWTKLRYYSIKKEYSVRYGTSTTPERLHVWAHADDYTLVMNACMCTDCL